MTLPSVTAAATAATVAGDTSCVAHTGRGCRSADASFPVTARVWWEAIFELAEVVPPDPMPLQNTRSGYQEIVRRR